jgi:hypothetical protein
MEIVVLLAYKVVVDRKLFVVHSLVVGCTLVVHSLDVDCTLAVHMLVVDYVDVVDCNIVAAKIEKRMVGRSSQNWWARVCSQDTFSHLRQGT